VPSKVPRPITPIGSPLLSLPLDSEALDSEPLDSEALVDSGALDDEPPLEPHADNTRAASNPSATGCVDGHRIAVVPFSMLQASPAARLRPAGSARGGMTATIAVPTRTVASHQMLVSGPASAKGTLATAARRKLEV
jgi:hypothetical protein